MKLDPEEAAKGHEASTMSYDEDETLGTQQKVQFGVISDNDYTYIYKSLLIETKEWYSKLMDL